MPAGRAAPRADRRASGSPGQPGARAERRYESRGVRGTLALAAEPASDILILTHGAGTDREAPLLRAVAGVFAGAGWAVLRYDLPFRQRQPKGPPSPARAEADREGIVHAAEAARSLVSGRVFAAGHSYGGRQTAMAAAENPGLFGALLLLSYPLHPPGRPDRPRTAFFPELRTPALFVHGDSDPFGSLEELREASALIPAPVEVLPVHGAGHELKGIERQAEAILARLRQLAPAFR